VGEVRFTRGKLQIDTTGDGAADFVVLMPGVAALAESQILGL
jgi:hypothetical protein